jgi:hypothetical protein
MSPFFNILLVLEWISCLVSLAYFKRLKQEGLIFIPVLLLAVVISETVGKLIQTNTIQFIKSVSWFNVMVPVQFICLFLLFHAKTEYRYWSYVIRIFILLTFLLTMVYIFSSQGRSFNTLNYTIEAVFVSACCLHYLFECMNSRFITSIHKNPLLYLALGTLLFYLGTLPLHSMYNYLYSNYKSIFYPYYYTFYVLNFVMYGLISFGILWAQKK